METTVPVIDQESNEIIRTYQIIYAVIFKFGGYIIVGILSFFIMAYFGGAQAEVTKAGYSGQMPLPAARSITVSGDLYTAKRITLTPDLSGVSLSVSVLGGFIETTPAVLRGYGNLTEYSGMMLPFSVNTTLENQTGTKGYFSSDNYDPSTLASWIQHYVLTNPFAPGTIPPLPIHGSVSSSAPTTTKQGAVGVLEAAYGLQCVGYFHLTSFFCNKNIEYFIADIPHIDIQKNLSQLVPLVQSFMKTDYEKPVCDAMQQAFDTTPVEDNNRESIFELCGQAYVDTYHRVIDFTNASLELQGIANDQLYTDDDINVFKLLSLQQKIYQNILQKKYDTDIVETYVSYVQNLVMRRKGIDQVYRDIIYMYNNVFLQQYMTQIAIQTTDTKALLKVSQAVKDINEGLVNLKSTIGNKALITYVEGQSTAGTGTTSITTFQDLFAGTFASFNNFTITNQSVDTKNLGAHVEGYFVLPDQSQVSFVGDYVFKDNQFLLSSASFPDNPQLSAIITNSIAGNPQIGISFIYELIQNNSNPSAKLSICDLLGLQRVTVQNCTPNNVLIEGSLGSVSIGIQGYQISSITSDNATLQASLRTSSASIITTQQNIVGVIQAFITAASGK